MMITVAVAAVSLGGVLVATRATIDTVQRVPDLAADLSASSSTVENFLLVGSDSRANSDPNSPDFGGIGTTGDVQGTRSDTIMVLRHDLADGSMSLVSIPRDLWVDIPGKGMGRINSAYNDGAAGLVRTVQQSLGIPVQHYVEVDFSGFKGLVDAIGGVQVCFLFPTRDTNTGLSIEVPGCRVLDGVQALAYARSRHYEEFRDGSWHEDGTADLGRTKRQQQFVKTALSSALERVKADPFAAGRIISSSAGAVRIDDELDLVAAASALRPAMGDGLQTFSLPVVGKKIDGKSVLLLGKGSDELLAYFRGEGPVPTNG